MPKKPKPTNLKLLQGNPGKRPINRREPQPESVAEVPEWLSDDPIAVETWNRLAPELTALGILTNLDQDLFVIYCDSVSRFRRNRALMNEDGEILQSRAGGKFQNPHLPVLRKERDTIRVLASLFGLSPSDRTRIEVDLKLDRGAELAAELLDD